MPTEPDVREMPAAREALVREIGRIIDPEANAAYDADFAKYPKFVTHEKMHFFPAVARSRDKAEQILALLESRATRETAKAEARRPRYRHIKRGSTYEVVGNAELQCTGPIEEGRILTIYQGEDGKWWARPAAEFGDGRFERISEALPAAIRKLAEG